MASVTRFARPLGWVVDLDLRGDDARVVADFLRQLPRPKRGTSWSYDAVAIWAQINLDVLETIDADPTSKLQALRETRQRVLPHIIERCAALDGYLSLVGIGLLARTSPSTATSAALRRLTRDPRIHERLGL